MRWRAPSFARIFLGSLVLTLPAALVLGVLAWTEALAAGTAVLATLAIYLGVALVSGPLFSGLAQVRAALQALAQGATALPDIVTLSPTARELGRDVGRFARALRETVAESAEARASAEAVLSALPEPLLLIDSERRIVSANPSALDLLGPRLAGRDLGAALRVSAVLEATDAVLAGGGGRTVEVDLPGLVEAADLRGRRRRRHAHRHHRHEAQRADAAGLRRQCQPRVANAARDAPGFHRDAARTRPRRQRGARALSLDHGGTGEPDGAAGRRPALALAHRAQRAPGAEGAGRSPARADRGRRWPGAAGRQAADADRRRLARLASRRGR